VLKLLVELLREEVEEVVGIEEVDRVLVVLELDDVEDKELELDVESMLKVCVNTILCLVL